jgi:hypothetical protein
MPTRLRGLRSHHLGGSGFGKSFTPYLRLDLAEDLIATHFDAVTEAGLVFGHLQGVEFLSANPHDASYKSRYGFAG